MMVHTACSELNLKDESADLMKVLPLKVCPESTKALTAPMQMVYLPAVCLLKNPKVLLPAVCFVKTKRIWPAGYQKISQQSVCSAKMLFWILTEHQPEELQMPIP